MAMNLPACGVHNFGEHLPILEVNALRVGPGVGWSGRRREVREAFGGRSDSGDAQAVRSTECVFWQTSMRCSQMVGWGNILFQGLMCSKLSPGGPVFPGKRCRMKHHLSMRPATMWCSRFRVCIHWVLVHGRLLPPFVRALPSDEP